MAPFEYRRERSPLTPTECTHMPRRVNVGRGRTVQRQSGGWPQSARLRSRSRMFADLGSLTSGFALVRVAICALR